MSKKIVNYKESTMRSIIGITLFMTLLLAAGCAPAEKVEAPAPVDTTAADVAALVKNREAYIVAENAGDAAGIAALYAANATFMPPDQPAVMGSAGVQAHYEAVFARMTPSLTVNSRETHAAGDIGYDAGSFSLQLTPKAGGAAATQISGNYLMLAGRQADGSWKITNMIVNTDAPGMMPAPPAAGK
jgi:ketosteroid isomerase-like protein